MQPQPVQAEPLRDRAVVSTLAMGAVTDQGMGDLFEVATNLMSPASQGLGEHQGIT